MAAPCPDDDVLAAFFERELPEKRRAEIEAHLSECGHCAGAISMMVSAYAERTSEHVPSVGPLPSPGSRLGRYHVLELVGAGAMGAVFGAYDPQLQRRVALKIQLPGQDVDSSDRQDRFVSEARAMATVSHPNVIAVHDVGVHEGTAFVAMEFVEGQTLRQWLEAQHSREAILETFTSAARGLAAAHAKGLVHRDFKPDNVLVGDDGRVRVIDFGLVRFIDGGAETPIVVDDDTEIDPSSTKTGAIVGTPAYMAPEQLRGEPATVASDQYAFCVALFEALCGQRPFQAKTVAMMLVAATKGEVTWPSSASWLPRRLRAGIERGLRPEPTERFETMAGLVQRLQHRRFGRWAPAAAVGVVVVGAVSVQVWLANRTEVCAGAEAQLAEVWDDATRDTVQQAIVATGADYATRAWEATRSELDAYAESWVAMHREVCRATNVSRTQSPEVMDLRMGCLGRAKMNVAAVVEVLGTADRDVVYNVHRVLGQLEPLERCADVERLQATVEPPLQAEAQRVDAARVRIAAAKAEDNAGRSKAAVSKVEEARGVLEGVDYGPVLVELALVDGEVRIGAGDYEAAVESLEQVLERAPRHRQWTEARRAAIALIYVLSERLDKPEQGLRIASIARGLAHDTPEELASIRNNVGNALKVQGKYAEAEVEFRLALEERAEALGSDHLSVAQVRANLAQALLGQGKLAEAEAELIRAQEVEIATLGPSHPVVSRSSEALAAVEARQGDLAGALESFRRSLAARIAVLGPEHPDVASSHSNVAAVLGAQGKFAEAEAETRRAITLIEKAIGPDAPELGRMFTNLAYTLSQQQRFDDAEGVIGRALEIQQAVLGPEHPQLAMILANRAEIYAGQGRFDDAETDYRRAIEVVDASRGPLHADSLGFRQNLAGVLEDLDKDDEAIAMLRRVLDGRIEAFGAEHPEVAVTRKSLASLLLDAGELDEAIVLAEAAQRKVESAEMAPVPRAEVAFVLARALWQRADEGDRARSSTLAQAALEAYREAAAPGLMAEVEQWQTEHRVAGG